MVKMEEIEDDEKPANIKIEIETLPQVGISNLSLPSSLPVCETEGSLPSSSTGHMRSTFIGMGFSPALVDKVMKERGEEDADVLLETLLEHSAPGKNSSLESLDVLDNVFSPNLEEDDSPFEVFTSDSEVEESVAPINLESDKRSSLLAMNFSMEEVDLAIKHLGHFFNPQYMYRTDGRRDEYDNTSEVLMGAKNVIRRMLEDENRAILACKQMHDYRLMQYHFGTGTAQRAVKILSPGENAPLPELIDLIVAVQAENSRERDINGSGGMLGRLKERALEAMFGTMDATLRLLDMGFTEQEISSAVDNFGSEVPVCQLADSILANHNAHNCVKEEEDWSEDSSNHSWQSQNEQRCPDHLTEECKNCFCATNKGKTATNSNMDASREIRTGIMAKHFSVYEKTEGCSKRSFSATQMGQDMISSLDNDVSDYKEMQKGKKAKYISESEKSTIYGSVKEERIPKSEDRHYEMPISFKGLGHFSTGFCRVNEHEQCNTSQHVHHFMSKAPFFFYGNVVDISQGTWRKLSHFLYGIEPEHVNTQFFSAFIRNEGYFHNLPRENRLHILPKPPLTIEDALPHTKKWWPSWDTRKQFSCISLDTVGVANICKRLEKMLMDSHGIVSKEQQMDALHQCKTLNLVWVGEHRLSPIEPSQIERILGYPIQHTQIQGLELIDRLRTLKCCFQTDTLGYHISVLKELFPSGLRVLSLFSGVGGAEVTLHRLGIFLKCVISVEASEVNRRILRRWWQNTGQSGELQQIEGIERLTTKKIEALIEQFGGFDIVIGGSPCTCLPRGPSSGKSVGLDLNLFCEFVRVFQRVRSRMGQNL